MNNKYGESVKVKTKQEVIKHLEGSGRMIGAFYDIAAKEKMEREKSIFAGVKIAGEQLTVILKK